MLLLIGLLILLMIGCAFAIVFGLIRATFRLLFAAPLLGIFFIIFLALIL